MYVHSFLSPSDSQTSDSMKYLNNILASIDEPSSASAPPAARPPLTSRASLPARPNPTATNGGTPNAQPLKRKAEGEISNDVPTKIARPLTPAQNGGAARPTVASASGTLGYRGTARPEVGKPAIKPLQKTQTMPTSVKPPIKTEPRTVPPVKASAPTAPAPVAKAPKKGSFQEILARAKQNQATIATLGVIKHKQTEKLSKKERERLAQEAAEKAKASAVKKVGNGARTGSAEPGPQRPGEQPKEKRKVVDLGYTGTARPKAKSAEPQYKGTMGLPRPGQVRKPMGAQKEAPRYSRYADYSDEDLDEEEDYESDLSDMEAGLDDVEEEEEMALREAKKDDAREKAIENELKRQKQERKHKLSALAAAARKKKSSMY